MLYSVLSVSKTTDRDDESVRRECWNWQTGKTKDLVGVCSCGFKSHLPHFAEVAELADAHGSGPCDGNIMRVQVPSSALDGANPNTLFLVKHCVGFVIVLENVE